MEPNAKSSPKASKPTGQSDSDQNDAGFFVSCWGRLKLAKLVQWTKRRRRSTPRTPRRGLHQYHRHVAAPLDCKSMDCKSIADSLVVVQPRPVAAGGFKYDAVSYSQNFDEGKWQEQDIEAFQRGFSSRYAAPGLAPLPRHHHHHPPPPPPMMRSLIDE